MDRRRAKGRVVSELPELAPEASAALTDRVAQVAAALTAGQDPESLKNLVTSGESLAWDLNLMAALANLTHPAIPPLLAALFGACGDKERRKALKRAFHKLKTRGVPVSTELLPREEPTLGAPPYPAIVKAEVSPVLGNGDSYVILEGPKEILGGNFLVARLSDVAGLRECHLLNIKGKQQQNEFWDHYRQHGLSQWFPVPGAYAARLLEQGWKHPDAEAAAKSSYGALRQKVLENWGRPEDAPDLEAELPPLDPGERSRLLEQSRQLVTDPLFQTWMPALEEISPWLEKFQEVQDSPLVLSDQQKQVRTDALLDEATRTHYPPENRPFWRRRLLAMAYYLKEGHRLEEARTARAAADELADPAPSSLSGENPFLKSLVQLALRLAWEFTQRDKTGRSESGLLTLPGDSRHLRR